MFKIKYNIIAGLVVLLQLGSLALLYITFGLSNEADIFLLTFSIVGSIQLVELMFFEQFMFFYHRLQHRNVSSAQSFYHFSFTLASIVGVFIFLFFFLLDKNMYAFGLSGYRLELYLKLFHVMTIGLLFYPLLALNDRLLNANSYFGSSYIVASSMHIGLFIALLIVVIKPSLGVVFLGMGYAVGILVGVVFSIMFIVKQLSYTITFTLKHKEGVHFIKKSLGMRLGHNIFMVLFYPITNYYLAQLPNGSVSLFYYVYRAVVSLYSITAGPSFKMYMAKVSVFWAKKKSNAIRLYSSSYLRSASLMYAIGITIVYLVLLFILPQLLTYFNLGLAAKEVSIMQNLYALIALWQFIILIESAYVAMIISSQDFKKFIYINSIFISSYALLVYIFIDYMLIYALGLSLILSQLLNLVLYRYYSKKKLGAL